MLQPPQHAGKYSNAQCRLQSWPLHHQAPLLSLARFDRLATGVHHRLECSPPHMDSGLCLAAATLTHLIHSRTRSCCRMFPYTVPERRCRDAHWVTKAGRLGLGRAPAAPAVTRTAHTILAQLLGTTESRQLGAATAAAFARHGGGGAAAHPFVRPARQQRLALHLGASRGS